MATLLIVLGAFALFAVLLFNGLVSKRNRVDNAFASIDVMLKKRFDLIPSLVETAKGYAIHERDTLESLALLRSEGQREGLSLNQRVDLDNQLTQTFFALQEGYPDLKADRQFLFLQRSLNEIEEQISAARRAFNAAVTDYNNAVEMFPSNLMANAMRYERRSLFEIATGERAAVDVGRPLGGAS